MKTSTLLMILGEDTILTTELSKLNTERMTSIFANAYVEISWSQLKNIELIQKPHRLIVPPLLHNSSKGLSVGVDERWNSLTSFSPVVETPNFPPRKQNQNLA